MSDERIAQLYGKDLAGFRIEGMHEVFEEDSSGSYIGSKGFFVDQNIAVVFSELQAEKEDPGNNHLAHQFLVRQVPVLTNGVLYFVLKTGEVRVRDDEVEGQRMRQELFNSLTPAKRKLLGLE